MRGGARADESDQANIGAFQSEINNYWAAFNPQKAEVREKQLFYRVEKDQIDPSEYQSQDSKKCDGPQIKLRLVKWWKFVLLDCSGGATELLTGWGWSEIRIY